jgi:hypothetical protein
MIALMTGKKRLHEGEYLATWIEARFNGAGARARLAVLARRPARYEQVRRQTDTTGRASEWWRSAKEKGHQIMSKVRVLMGLALLISSAAFAWADDEVKRGRSIVKEPAYQSNAPGYCLLTFGREGKTRVWLVFDSVPDPLKPGDAEDYLYVDRNGNGDLTEPGARVAAVVHKRKIHVTFGKGFYDETLLEFDVGPVGGPGGKEKRRSLKVWVSWYRGQERPCTLSLKTEGQFCREESVSGVIFSRRPEDAPVLRFDGPLTMRFALGMKHSLSLTEEFNLQAEVGTVGSGPDSFVSMRNDTFPKDLHPVAEIEWPHRGANKPPIKMRVTLNQRC